MGVVWLIPLRWTEGVPGNGTQHYNGIRDEIPVHVVPPLQYRTYAENKSADRQMVVLAVGQEFVESI